MPVYVGLSSQRDSKVNTVGEKREEKETERGEEETGFPFKRPFPLSTLRPTPHSRTAPALCSIPTLLIPTPAESPSKGSTYAHRGFLHQALGTLSFTIL